MFNPDLQFVQRLLALGLVAAASCSPRLEPSPIPAGITYVPRAMWGAHAPVLPMKVHTPTRLTIHHTGTQMRFDRSLEAKIKSLQEFSQRDDSLSSGKKKPAWADVPYHYYVSVDGRVAEGREWIYVGDSNTPYDPTGHLLVVIEGSFEKDTLTTAQNRTLDILVPALARHFHIASARLASHKDFAETSCPGQNVYSQLPRWRDMIDKSTATH